MIIMIISPPFRVPEAKWLKWKVGYKTTILLPPIQEFGSRSEREPDTAIVLPNRGAAVTPLCLSASSAPFSSSSSSQPRFPSHHSSLTPYLPINPIPNPDPANSANQLPTFSPTVEPGEYSEAPRVSQPLHRVSDSLHKKRTVDMNDT